MAGQKSAASCTTTPPNLPVFRRLRLKLSQKLARRSALAGEKLLPALGDVSADLRILELEVVLELVNIHDAGERDAVLLEDHILLVQVHALHDGAERVPGLGEGETLDHRT